MAALLQQLVLIDSWYRRKQAQAQPWSLEQYLVELPELWLEILFLSILCGRYKRAFLNLRQQTETEQRSAILILRANSRLPSLGRGMIQSLNRNRQRTIAMRLCRILSDGIRSWGSSGKAGLRLCTAAATSS